MKRAILFSCVILLSGFLAAQTTLVISATGLDKIYDGNTQASVILQDNREAGKVFDVHYIDANFDTWDVGVDKPILVSGIYLTGPDAGDYSYNSTAVTSADITPRPVVGKFTVADKIYDGNTDATIIGRALSDVLSGDEDGITIIGGTANFNDPNAGNDKPVNQRGMMLTGQRAFNYYLDFVTPTIADILPRNIIGSFTVADKIYDRTTAAVITARSLQGISPLDNADIMLIGGTAVFYNCHAEEAKLVIGSGFTIIGASSINYNVIEIDLTTTATIFPKPIDIVAVQDIKVYDQTSESDETPYADPPLITGDTGFYWQVFDDKNIGTGKTLYPFGDIEDGNNGNNYIITWVINYDGVILPASSSVHNVSENEFFLAYPSPNNGTFNFEYYSISTEKVELSILDISGKIILDKQYPMAGYHIKDKINIPDKAKGIYFVRLIDGQSVSYRKLIVE